MRKLRRYIFVLLLATMAFPARPADAGCGCAKAPPPPAAIRPAFVPAGGTLTLFPPGAVEGATYSVAFGAGTTTAVSTIAVRKRDYSDGVYKPQLVVTVPDLPPGPTPVTVTSGGTSLLTVAAQDFTVLQHPLTLDELDLTTIASCYRAAVGGDGTVYFPFDISPIGQAMTFSGALRGYRLTFAASDISIYNAQGVLMQLLGPAEAGIFSIQDDGSANGPLVAQTGSDDVQPDRVSIDFDEVPGPGLDSFYLVGDTTRVSLQTNAGTGNPSTNGVQVDHATSAVTFLRSLGGFVHDGSRLAESVDVRWANISNASTVRLGVVAANGGQAWLQLATGTGSQVQVSFVNGEGSGEPTGVGPAQVLASTSPRWLRLRAAFTATGGQLQYGVEVLDIGDKGTGTETSLIAFSGTVANATIVGNPVVLGGFSGTSPTNKIFFDDFTEQFVDGTPVVPTGDPGLASRDDGVDRTVPSFRLTYDRHEFQTYRSLHAIDPNYFLDPTDPAWHVDGTRHIDHDHLIIAVHGLVNQQVSPAPGSTPPFDFHVTTELAGAPSSGTPPVTVLEGKCEVAGPPAPAPACAAVPQTSCGAPLGRGAARLALRHDEHAQLAWAWRAGQATPVASFGDPMTSDGVALCLYDGAGSLLFQADAAAGGTCRSHRRHARGRPCWRPLGKLGKPRRADGYRFHDPSATTNGISDILLRAGARGRARIEVAGQGENLALPPMPLPVPFRVQLQAHSGQCWEAAYSAKGVRQNTAARVKATAD